MKNKKLGDIYRFQCNDGVGYFQYIGNDNSQMGADIVRVFKGVYSESVSMTLLDLENIGVDYYALTMVKIGLKMQWCTIYARQKTIDIPNIWFRTTPDYGYQLGEEPIQITDRWILWQPNQAKTKVNGLRGEHTQSYGGLIRPVVAFIDRANAGTGKYVGVYPEPNIFEP
jgi:hypothetical protein